MEVDILLKELFSDSSDDEGQRTRPDSCTEARTYENIDGLVHINTWLDCKQQDALLAAVTASELLNEQCNQSMLFGQLPDWIDPLTDHFAACAMPAELLCRRPLFNQLILNRYAPGEGITDHVDLMRFQDGIAVISLGSSCIMNFKPVRKDQPMPTSYRTGDSTAPHTHHATPAERQHSLTASSGTGRVFSEAHDVLNAHSTPKAHDTLTVDSLQRTQYATEQVHTSAAPAPVPDRLQDEEMQDTNRYLSQEQQQQIHIHDDVEMKDKECNQHVAGFATQLQGQVQESAGAAASGEGGGRCSSSGGVAGQVLPGVQYTGALPGPESQQPVQVLLEPGDLLVLSGPARYEWTHGIQGVKQELHHETGQVIQRGTRISITLRRLCDNIVLTEPA